MHRHDLLNDASLTDDPARSTVEQLWSLQDGTFATRNRQAFFDSLIAMTHQLQSDGSGAILPAHECWDLLAGVTLGRLVTSVDGQPEIFPVNYVVQRRTILFRTAEGTKLVSAVINNHVLFEADDHNVAEGWSVIVKGRARTLHTEEEINDAERAQVLSWTSSEKSHYVRVMPETITGRRFQFGSPPMEESIHA